MSSAKHPIGNICAVRRQNCRLFRAFSDGRNTNPRGGTARDAPWSARMADPAPQTPNAKPAPDAAAMAEAALAAAQSAVSNLNPGAADAANPLPFEPQPLTKPTTSAPAKGIDLLSDVNLNVKIELGRTRMLVEDVLKLADGAVVELDKLAGDPVDVYVNDRHIASAMARAAGRARA
jgi:flagellar motor switch protein FliN